MQMGAAGLDMAVPSDYMVDIMTKLSLLDPLHKSDLPNIKNISSRFLKQAFDPENTYSVPYSWTTTGIAVNRKLYKGSIKGWKDVLNNPALAGKFCLLDDVREVLAMALKISGHSVNTTDEKELSAAQDMLLKVKKDVKNFTSDTLEVLKNKEVLVAQAYSVDALQAAVQSQQDIEYIIPEEGGTRSIDNLVIFKSAKNKSQAHALINFLLTAENNVSFVKNVRAGPVIEDTRQSLPAELKSNSALFPSDPVLKKLEGLVDLGEANRLYENIWSKIKTQ